MADRRPHPAGTAASYTRCYATTSRTSSTDARRRVQNEPSGGPDSGRRTGISNPVAARRGAQAGGRRLTEARSRMKSGLSSSAKGRL